MDDEYFDRLHFADYTFIYLLKWYGHVSRYRGMATTILRGTVPGGRKPGHQKLRWEDRSEKLTVHSLDKHFLRVILSSNLKHFKA